MPRRRAWLYTKDLLTRNPKATKRYARVPVCIVRAISGRGR